MGAFEGGLTDGFLPWKSFGQEFAWNWCAQSLVSIAADGSILYDLATSYDVSADGKTYTFHLVEGATWHDGKPVTAADVAFTYNTGLKVDGRLEHRRTPRADQGLRRGRRRRDPRLPRASGSSTTSRSRSTSTSRMPRSCRTCSRSSASRRSTRSTAWRSRTTPTQPISQELFIGSGPYKMTEFKAKEFVNFEAHAGYKNGTGYSGPPAADEGLDPDLRRRRRADPVDAGRRGRLQLRPQARAATSSRPSRRSAG